MKKALITGITGQDGAYLAEFLLNKGYEVHGIKRRSSLFNTDRIDHLYQGPHQKGRKFVLHYGDLSDAGNLIRIMQEVQPDEVLEEARQLHSFDEYFKKEDDEPSYEMGGKKITLKLLLEAIRTLPEEKRKAILLYYFEGMNDTKIAKLFNTSRSTIQYRRTSSFELLRKYLEENADEWDEW